jgi:Xylose isomerase-like TIM barrel
MHNRRHFIRKTGALALGSLILTRHGYASFFNSAASHPVGLQLFTLFNTIDKDVPGTLKQIAQVGYLEIESAFSMKGGFYGMKPKEFASLAKDSGLAWVSHHVGGAPFKMPPGGFRMPGSDTSKQGPPPPPRRFPPMKNLKENHQEIIDDVAEGGLKYLVCASIPLSTTDEIKESIDILNTSGEAAKKSGITLCYHNHIHEFEPVDGKLPYDQLLTQTSPDTLKFELDLGWATKAGADPIELFTKNPGRFPLWHVKDISADKKEPTEVGNGIVDFKRIFAGAKTSGMQHFFVEQDGAPSPIENITTSFNYIKTKILV